MSETTTDIGPGRRVVGVFAMGGTIAMTTSPGGTGVLPTLGAHDLIAAVPGLEGTGVELVVHDLCRLPGGSLRFQDVADAYTVIRGEFESGAITGAVITQGTDTIEESCWLLALLHSGQEPIVVTGAMRNPSTAGADGPANLVAAVTVAASPDARGLGVVVVLGDEVHAARSVRKTHATSISSFRSPDFGPLGHVGEGRFVLGRRTSPVFLPSALVSDALADLQRPRVAVLPMTLDQDPTLLEAIAPGLDGLVIAGFGVGHVPMAAVQSLDELADRLPVVISSRTGAGSTARRTYAFPGSEADLLDRGLIAAGYLDPYKSRVLLHVLLAAGATDTTMRRTFRRLGEYA